MVSWPFQTFSTGKCSREALQVFTRFRKMSPISFHYRPNMVILLRAFCHRAFITIFTMPHRWPMTLRYHENMVFYFAASLSGGNSEACWPGWAWVGQAAPCAPADNNKSSRRRGNCFIIIIFIDFHQCSLLDIFRLYFQYDDILLYRRVIITY